MMINKLCSCLFVCILVKFDAQLLMMYLYKLLSSLKFEFPSLYPVVGDHSTLLVSFHLKRHMGDFVIQVGIIVWDWITANIFQEKLYLREKHLNARGHNVWRSISLTTYLHALDCKTMGEGNDLTRISDKRLSK